MHEDDPLQMQYISWHQIQRLHKAPLVFDLRFEQSFCFAYVTTSTVAVLLLFCPTRLADCS